VNHSLADKRGLDSLPVIADWQEWWREWGPKIASQHGKQGWVLFLLDAQEKIQEVSMLASRVIRNKAPWEARGWTEAEWGNVEAEGEAAVVWFATHAPGPLRDAPEWAQFLFTAQHGNLCSLARLCRELRGLQEQGYKVAVVERQPAGLRLDDAATEILLQETA